jgi:hypothetical protein
MLAVTRPNSAQLFAPRGPQRSGNALITAFVTHNLFIVIPILIETNIETETTLAEIRQRGVVKVGFNENRYP